ncbi:MAG: carboxymuconolactone decarboxylase family protein [Gammaproteobacteria bacterium]
MSRITTITADRATAEQQALFDAIHAQLGFVPNFLRVFANSPAALKAFLGLFGIAGSGSLERTTRERIALAVAQQNECAYCLSAHTLLGAKAGLSNEEIHASRAGTSADARAAQAVKFARAILLHNGEVSTADLLEVRNAGYSDAEIVEIITHVGLNFLTNILNNASHVEIDFPTVDVKLAA